MALFEPSYRIGRRREGGYSNVSTDKGEETYCGVSRKYHPTFTGWVIIDQIKLQRHIKNDEVIKDAGLEALLYTFYNLNFWNKILGGKINSQAIASYIYDWSLTSGGALKQVQRLVGVEPDGIFGEATVSAINEKGGLLLPMLKDCRMRYYQHLVDNDSTQLANLKGWLNRAKEVYEEVCK